MSKLEFLSVESAENRPISENRNRKNKSTKKQNETDQVLKMTTVCSPLQAVYIRFFGDTLSSSQQDGVFYANFNTEVLKINEKENYLSREGRNS